MSIRDLTIDQWSETVTENLPTDGTTIGRVLAKHNRRFKRSVLSGPPGTQKEQVSGTELSKKCFCFSPGSSGIMKPCMR